MTEHAPDLIDAPAESFDDLMAIADAALAARGAVKASAASPQPARLAAPQMTASGVTVDHDKLERFRPMIERGVEHMHCTADQVLADVAAGRAHLWPGEKSVIVSYVDELLDGTRAFCVRVAEGDKDEILAMIPGLKAVARAMGCQIGISEGRKGWERVLGATGWKPYSVTMWCEL